MSKLDAWIKASPERARAFAQELLITETTEEIWAAMEHSGISNTEVANRLGKTKAFIGQVLNGTRNMTLRTLSDIAGVLGRKVTVTLEEVDAATDWQPIKGERVVQFRRTHFLSGEIESCNGDEWQNIEQSEADHTKAA